MLKAIKLQKSVLSSLGFTYDKDSIDESFSENVEIQKIGDDTFYQDIASGNIAFEIHGMGVQGPIDGMVALTPDLQKIHGISIVHQEETPGLGGRIAEAEFLDRFKGKIITKGLFILPPGKAHADNEVHGITGATFSCNAFEEILNNEIKRYVAMIEESK